MTADQVKDLVDTLAAALAGMPADQVRAWVIGLCRRLDQAGAGDVFDSPDLWHELRDRQALGKWPGSGSLWGKNAPDREAIDDDDMQQ